jgi:hypothetical protein
VPKVLLTATPLQNSLMELYGLVSLIDDYAFGDAKSFRTPPSWRRRVWRAEGQAKARQTGNLPDKLSLQRKARELETKRDEAWRAYDVSAREIEVQKDGLLDQLEERLAQQVGDEELFAVRFQIRWEGMPLTSVDVAGEKREDLKRVLGATFPEIFDEGKIDFDELKRALGEWVDPGKERFGLQWPGKADCLKVILQPSVATLKPVREQSVDFDTTGNIFIEGGNLAETWSTSALVHFADSSQTMPEAREVPTH